MKEESSLRISLHFSSGWTSFAIRDQRMDQREVKRVGLDIFADKEKRREEL
jgi:hypothetical protein